MRTDVSFSASHIPCDCFVYLGETVENAMKRQYRILVGHHVVGFCNTHTQNSAMFFSTDGTGCYTIIMKIKVPRRSGMKRDSNLQK